jgi:hypothetical protein
MFKAFTILALGAIASAQFLNRDLQGATTTATTPAVTLQQAATSVPANNVTVATAFSTACTATAAGTTDSCPGTHCCASLKRAGAAVATAGTVCAPLWFSGVNFNVSNVVNTWTCINQVNTKAWANLTASRTACDSDANCTVGSCCATFTHTFGPATGFGTVATKACIDGTTNGTAGWSSYPATFTTVATSARTDVGSCTNVAPASFGAYIKASAMMLVALLSVALF